MTSPSTGLLQLLSSNRWKRETNSDEPHKVHVVDSERPVAIQSAGIRSITLIDLFMIGFVDFNITLVHMFVKLLCLVYIKWSH